MLPDASVWFYRAQQRRSVLALGRVAREWAKMGSNFEQSWRQVGPRLAVLLAAAQLGAARDGAAYVPRVLDETGQAADPEGELEPRSLAGVASDGRPLDGLLYGAVVTAGRQHSTGQTVPQALAAGGAFLSMATRTQIADAGRDATSAAMVARPQITGYVRMVNPPTCPRCAVLAGKWFGWNMGFERHPRCDCTHIPAAEDMAGDLRTDPVALVREGQVTGLSKADAAAIKDGADVAQVINAHRGMRTAQVYGRKVKITTEGTTVRGFAGKRIGASRTPRLRPEAIYQVAEDRADAIRLLKRFGYIV